MAKKFSYLPDVLVPCSFIGKTRKKTKLEASLFSLELGNNESFLRFFDEGYLLRNLGEENLCIYPNGSVQIAWNLKYFGRNISRENLRRNKNRILLKGKKDKYYESKLRQESLNYIILPVESTYFLGNKNRKNLKKTFEFFSHKMLDNLKDYFYPAKRNFFRDFLLNSFRENYRR